ncbi:MAG: hypothetical protein JW765_05105 [Deltaproteobacteria bacterium]|nr:hypothetical protein [Candidatus Zymogenaceae bacterium]
MGKATGRFLRPFVIIISCFTILAFALPALAAYDFSVARDKSSYAAGTTVTIQLTNTGTNSLSLRSMRWMVQVKSNGGWREVFTEAAKPSTVSDDLPVGDIATWTWNGKDNEGTIQPAGEYRIKVWVIMPRHSYQDDKVTSSFTLTSGWSAAKDIRVTSNRAQYHVGGTVTFTIKNTGDVGLDTGNFSWIIYRHTSSGPQARSTHNSRPTGVPNPLLPGRSASWSWDMRNDSGGFVAADDYELEVKLPNVPDSGIEGNCFFKVIP